MAALIDLCNLALSEIAKGQIAGLTENSLEARECNRHAQPLLDEMADWSDRFPFTKRYEALAEVTNDRPAEWARRYAVPSDMAAPIMVREQEDTAVWLPKYGFYDFPRQDALQIPFLYENGHIYTNIEKATLAYSTSTLNAGDLPPLGQRAFVLELSARIAWPLTKDMKIVDGKRNDAEIARARFISDEENKNPRGQADYISDAEYARAGYIG